MNIFMFIIAREAGVSYNEFTQNYRKLVEGNLICLEKYGLDNVHVMSDPVRETAAFGAEIIFPENTVPYAKPLINGNFDLSALTRFDPFDSPRTLDRIKACELFHQKVGGDYPVIGWVEGCLAEAADLRGINDFLMDLATEETYLPELFDIILEQHKILAKAQVDAGADFVGVGNAVASLIGPNLYKKYGLEYDKAIIAYIRELGARSKLHICGNITSLLEMIVEVAPDIVDIDWKVDFAHAANVFKGTKTAVSGNFNPAGVILLGNAEAVKAEVRNCIEQGTETTLIAGGCEISVNTPDENLLAMDAMLYC